jgi:FkbM family methyltransferase
MTGIGTELYMGGAEAFEPETVAVFLDLCGRASVFFDVGAHIGQYTLLAKANHPALKVTAFEPQPSLNRALRDSLELNGWSDTRAEELALTDTDGELELYVPHGDSEASLNPDFRKPVEHYRIQAKKLDTYCAERGIPRIDLLKVDTESTEPRVLEGGRQVIGDCRPDIVCEVLLGRTERELTEFLTPLGYEFFHITERGPVRVEKIQGDPEYRQLNYLFTARGAP